MTEIQSENRPQTKQDILCRFNDKLQRSLLIRLPSQQRLGASLALKSARATEIPSPSNQRRGLLKKFQPEVVDKLTKIVDNLTDSVEGEFRLGSKILENSSFQEALGREYRELQIADPDQEKAFDYWIQNSDRLSKDQPLHRKIILGLQDKLGEIYHTARLLTMHSGLGVRNIGQKTNMGWVKNIGDKIIDAPVKLQMQSDLVDISQSETTDVETKIRETAKRYGLDSASVNILAHPDFRKRIAASLSLNVLIYTAPRQILGWGAYVGLLASPGFREMVESNGTNLTLTSAGLLMGMGAVRMAVDYAVLKARNYSPDILETATAQISGKLESDLKLKANPWCGLLGTPIDIAISSLQPPYSAAWFTNPPYSIPAYILAMGVDQGVFIATNAIWGIYGKIGKSQNKN